MYLLVVILLVVVIIMAILYCLFFGIVGWMLGIFIGELCKAIKAKGKESLTS